MASQETRHIALFHRAASEGTYPAVYNPEQEQDEEAGREISLAFGGGQMHVVGRAGVDNGNFSLAENTASGPRGCLWLRPMLFFCTCRNPPIVRDYAAVAFDGRAQGRGGEFSGDSNQAGFGAT